MVVSANECSGNSFLLFFQRKMYCWLTKAVNHEARMSACEPAEKTSAAGGKGAVRLALLLHRSRLGVLRLSGETTQGSRPAQKGGTTSTRSPTGSHSATAVEAGLA